MYISKLTPRGQTVAPGANIYETKKSVYSVFPGLQERRGSFVYRVASGKVFVLSEPLPVDTHNQWDIETRPFTPVTDVGTSMKFMVRVNARVDGEKPSSVVSRAIRNLTQEKAGKPLDEWPTGTAICKQAMLGWFREREGRFGFSVEDLSVRERSIWRMELSGAKKGNRKPFSSDVIELGGTLRVTDSKTFAETLLLGVGDARGFGCGMLVVKG